MRENMGIYRGKRIDNGEWVEGNLLTSNNKRRFIVTFCDSSGCFKSCPEILYIEVDPETVGEQTGRMDKNGKRIFEGDIVEEFCGVNGHRKQGAVYFDDLFQEFLFGYHNNLLGCNIYERKVIGNIYDNPELAKE